MAIFREVMVTRLVLGIFKAHSHLTCVLHVERAMGCSNLMYRSSHMGQGGDRHHRDIWWKLGWFEVTGCHLDERGMGVG